LPEEQKRDRLKSGVFDEYAAITSARDFLSERFKAEVLVYDEEDKQRYDPKKKAGMAVPMRPAIYVE
jgi:hypothetical protein